MKRTRNILLAVIALLLGGAAVWYTPSGNVHNQVTDAAVAERHETQDKMKSQSPHVEANVAPSDVPVVREETNAVASTEIGLTGGNFESYVSRCFKGEVCTFVDDPFAMYRRFKQSGNRRACDNLISFLRSKMKDEDYRSRYKVLLQKMIADFYPPEERQFQEAAYYNYLGELQKSLDLYLDLERKSQTDPSLRPAPKLNIANTLYDMKKYKESLPYYEAALDQYVSRQQEVAIPSQNEMIRFVEGRIEDVRQRTSQ